MNNFPRTFYLFGNKPDEFFILRFFWQMTDGDAYVRMIRFVIWGDQYAIKEKKDVIIPFGGRLGKTPEGYEVEEIGNDGSFPDEVAERLEAAGLHVPILPEKALDSLSKVTPEMDFERMKG